MLTLDRTQIEINFALICASAPVLRILVRRYLREPISAMSRARTQASNNRSGAQSAMQDSRLREPNGKVMYNPDPERDPQDYGGNGDKNLIHHSVKPSLDTVDESSSAPSETNGGVKDVESYAMSALKASRPTSELTTSRPMSPPRDRNGRMSPMHERNGRMSPIQQRDPRMSPAQHHDPRMSPAQEYSPQTYQSPGMSPIQQQDPRRSPAPQHDPRMSPARQQSPAASPVQGYNPRTHFINRMNSMNQERNGGMSPAQQHSPHLTPVQQHSPRASPAQQYSPHMPPVQQPDRNGSHSSSRRKDRPLPPPPPEEDQSMSASLSAPFSTTPWYGPNAGWEERHEKG